MSNKPLQYVLFEREIKVGKHKGQKMQVALPTGRKKVQFRYFCEMIARSTTFNEHEVAAIINYATEIAKHIVSNGNSVEFGDLGILSPSFKSEAVPLNETFNVRKHIKDAVISFRPSKHYFKLEDVRYEKVEK